MRPIRSLRNKFFRTLLLVTALSGVGTLGIVIVLSAQVSKRHLATVQQNIEEGISSKGRVLATSHALALRGLVQDNAFLDVRHLLERSVLEDPDLVYGLCVNAERQALAYSRHGVEASLERAPLAAAWEALGVPAGDLLVDHLVFGRRTRLGRDVLEVVAPIQSEEGELLGTVRYGLSTRRMHEASARARSESDQQLRQSMIAVGIVIVLISSLGLVLSRVQAVRITRPIAQLTQAAEDLASGGRSVRVDIDSGDEIERLGAAFNHMVRDLDASYGRLEEMNRTLEHKVQDRTAELGRKNRDMRLVLDNVDQGFFTLSPDGTISLEHSRVLGEWFGDYDLACPIWDYLAGRSRAFALQFRLCWEQVVDDFLPLEVTLSQLPERLVSGDRTFQFRYLPFFKQRRLEGVLVVVDEITERLAKERDEADQSDLMQGFKRVMLDRSGFALFLREATQMVEAICGRILEDDPVTFRRTIHTLKGNAASMGLAVVARLCHRMEEQLAEGAPIDGTLAELSDRWRAMTGHIASFSGLGSQRVIEVSEPEYTAFVSRLSSSRAAQPDLLDQVLSWQLEPLARPLHRLAEHARVLARRLDKGDIQTIVEANDIRVDAQGFSPFFAELVHVIRNAVDHGIESPGEREVLHKPKHGTLLLKAEKAGGVLAFEIADDGRGIDWLAIAAKAKEMGLPCSTQQQLTDALCADGVTTRLEATAVSGRGVGMAALLACLRKMDGRIDVRSVQGVGTSFTFRFPISGAI